jgi:hypothetical protein
MRRSLSHLLLLAVVGQTQGQGHHTATKHCHGPCRTSINSSPMVGMAKMVQARAMLNPESTAGPAICVDGMAGGYECSGMVNALQLFLPCHP